MKNLYLTILGVIITVGLMAQTNATIYQIQGQSAASPFVDDSVIVSGVVTAVDTNYSDNNGYFIQDGTGPWSGIYVYDYNNATSVNVGDSVRLQATVTEYYDFTELKNVKNFTVISSGNTVTPTVITATQANTEDYEGVLVTVKNLTCVSTPSSSTFGVWTGVNNSVEVKIDDFVCSMYAYTPTMNEIYDVTGVLDYGYSYYHINPRSANDVTTSSGVIENNLNNTKIYPIPANNNLTVSSEKEINSVELFNIVGAKILSYNVNSNNTNINVNSINAGVYFLKINFEKNSIMQKVIIK